MDLTCPKCRGPMQTYERNGVHVDQCADCRGIFLDRGELDRLIDAERAWHRGAPSASSGQPAQGGSLGTVVNEVFQQVRGQKHAGHGQQHGHGYPRRKKESFLGDLFG